MSVKTIIVVNRIEKRCRILCNYSNAIKGQRIKRKEKKELIQHSNIKWKRVAVATICIFFP